ncbi:MAG: 50S ribosomal protein L29 [bacterium]|nr:50S ribosomal protein L29 [bacterium]
MARSRPLTGLSDVELLGMLDEAKDEATNLRFQHVTGQLDNMNLLAHSRREVARILTELRAREIDAAEAAMAGQADEVQEPTDDEASVEAPARVFKRRRRRYG